ncbi:hypothetical protein FACS189494_09970 [Spirochaetia bacterium]|nr:hypothetical protein FACS189494_09970 [Spirochaetia bacterium]
MIRSLSSSTFVNAPVLSGSSGKASVPVSAGSVIYSHFKHVSGVPAPEGVQGANVSRLKILDTLIERLSQLKKSANISFQPENERNDRLDALIAQYQTELKQAGAKAAAMPYAVNPQIASGTFFNLTA